MSVTPILFSGHMVRALLEGRKTQTRRLLKPRPTCPPGHHLTGMRLRWESGDLLWVREQWSIEALGGASGGGLPSVHTYELVYRADGHRLGLEYEGPPERDPYVRWYDTQRGNSRPSIHMPRQFSRLALEVTEVRVERLRHITVADARAEGFAPLPDGGDERHAFLDYWNELHGPGATDLNPWVVALSFKVHRANVGLVQVGRRQELTEACS